MHFASSYSDFDHYLFDLEQSDAMARIPDITAKQSDQFTEALNQDGPLFTPNTSELGYGARCVGSFRV